MNLWVCAQFRSSHFSTSSHKYVHSANNTTLRNEAVVGILFLKMGNEKAEITLSNFFGHFFSGKVHGRKREVVSWKVIVRSLIFGSRYQAWNHFPCYVLQSRKTCWCKPGKISVPFFTSMWKVILITWFAIIAMVCNHYRGSVKGVETKSKRVDRSESFGSRTRVIKSPSQRRLSKIRSLKMKIQLSDCYVYSKVRVENEYNTWEFNPDLISRDVTQPHLHVCSIHSSLQISHDTWQHQINAQLHLTSFTLLTVL